MVVRSAPCLRRDFRSDPHFALMVVRSAPCLRRDFRSDPHLALMGRADTPVASDGEALVFQAD